MNAVARVGLRSRYDGGFARLLGPKLSHWWLRSTRASRFSTKGAQYDASRFRDLFAAHLPSPRRILGCFSRNCRNVSRHTPEVGHPCHAHFHRSCRGSMPRLFLVVSYILGCTSRLTHGVHKSGDQALLVPFPVRTHDQCADPAGALPNLHLFPGYWSLGQGSDDWPIELPDDPCTNDPGTQAERFSPPPSTRCCSPLPRERQGPRRTLECGLGTFISLWRPAP